MKKDNSPLVSIILPCYNAEKVVKRCVRNFLGTSYKNFEMILIDDGSKDNTYKEITDNFGSNPKIKILQNSQNLGIARTKNKGIRAAKGKYIAVLETDMEVEPDWLTHIVESMEKDPSVGGVQAKELDLENRNLIQMAGLLFIPHTFWVINVGLSKRKEEFNKEMIVGIGTGGCVVRKDILEKINYYDEKMAYGQGDADSNWGIWMLGYKTMMQPKSIIYHDTGKPANERKVSTLKVELNFHKTPRVFLKNYESANVLRYLPQMLIIFFIRAVLNLGKGNYKPLLGFIFGTLWNAVYFYDTLRARQRRQQNRCVKDREIMSSIVVKGTFISIYKKHIAPIVNTYRRHRRGALVVLNKQGFYENQS